MNDSSFYRNFRRLTIACGIICLTSVIVPAADWPHWRGPTRDGLSSEADWNPSALKEKKVLWSTELGKGYSSFAVVEDKLFTMGNVEGKDVVYCLDTTTGKRVWTHEYPCQGGNYAGPRATPCVEGEAVYTVSRDGQVFCLNKASGKVKWRRSLVDSFGAKLPRWGHAGSVQVIGEMAVIAAGRTGVALNRDTGRKIWSGGPGGYSYSSPVPFTADAKAAIAFFGPESITAVDMKTGRPLWSHPWSTKYGINAADPLMTDFGMFITSGYETGCAMLDVSKAAPGVLWQNKLVKAHFSSPVLIDGHIYAVDGNTGRGSLVCLDVRSGREQWRENRGFGALIAADRKIIFLNEKGSLYIVDAVPSGYRQIASIHSLLPKTCWTPPVLCNGAIYARNNLGSMVALAAK